MNVVSLLPGSLSADLDKDRVLIHALNKTSISIADLTACERQVALLFGIHLTEKDDLRKE
jgi:multicomponent Na+:H+ antiporter subunit E